MSGKAPQPVYHYDTEENGFKSLGKFVSRAEVFKMYFDGKKGRLFEDGYDYKKLPDDTYVTKYKIGREDLKKLIRVTEDPTCYYRKGDEEIEIYNYNNELVGVVKNIRILKAINSMNIDTILSNTYRGGEFCHFGHLNFKKKK